MSRIRYANCWEDAEPALAGLNVKAGGDYCAVGSAGDIVLALLSADPGSVRAVDVNPAQTALLELRCSAIGWGTREEVLRFLGVMPSRTREETYGLLRGRLSPAGRAFWDPRIGSVKRGIIHCGQVERYFRVFRIFFMPILLGRGRVKSLVASRAGGGARSLIERCLDTPEWRAFMRLFMHRRVLQRLDLGRAPGDYVRARYDLRSVVRPRLFRALESLSEGGSPFLDYITTGNFRGLPYYLRPDIFPAVKRNLSRLRVETAEIRSVLSGAPDRSFDGIYFSDVFEYLNDAGYRRAMALAGRCLRPAGRVVHWNNLIERTDPAGREDFLRLDGVERELWSQSRAFFYGSLTVLERR